MSVRGYGTWAPRRQSMFSAAYVTAPDTEPPITHEINNRLTYILNLYPKYCK